MTKMLALLLVLCVAGFIVWVSVELSHPENIEAEKLIQALSRGADQYLQYLGSLSGRGQRLEVRISGILETVEFHDWGVLLVIGPSIQQGGAKIFVRGMYINKEKARGDSIRWDDDRFLAFRKYLLSKQGTRISVTGTLFRGYHTASKIDADHPDRIFTILDNVVDVDGMPVP